MLAERILPKVSEWRPAGTGRHSWAEAFPDAGWTVRVTADKTDSLACLAWQIQLSRTAEPPAGLTLAGWAAAIAARVTGLLEPLKVHEIDESRGEAVLRSVAPARKGDTLAYYEILLQGGSTASLARYVGSKVRPGRQQVAFAITHETLAKLLEDIAG
jgi:hypothetical protein